MLIALVGLCASAQSKGDMAVGINLGFAPCLESGSKLTNFELGGKFQYNVSNPVRLEAALDYGFKSKEISALTFAVNAHYIVGVANRFTVYPLAGLGLAHLDSSYGYDDTKFLFNVGIGGEYAVSSNLSFGLEIKYQYIDNFGRMPILLGMTYRF